MNILFALKRTVNRNPFLRHLYEKSRTVLNIVPFFLYQEGLSNESQKNLKPSLEPCETIFLGPEDLKAITANPESMETEEALRKRLSRGCIGIGIKHHDEIISYMWGNVRECDCNYIKFKLRGNEAYLSHARTLNAYRGKNLAPYLRVEFYRILKKMGRDRIISITDYLNKPARRFKEKLDAKPAKLYITIIFFEKYRWTIPLKSYPL
ncbi:MAG: hypothetical protein A2V65_00760 [Deltaproteobacteria bacterium RBG_13_49_15]|nr:MAG: hypothetical protein A2V65_00760 [Deltaproteobacteria bacterium RBG_13_49_15]